MLTQAARRFSTRERAIRWACSSDSHVVRTTILSVIAELEYHPGRAGGSFVAQSDHWIDLRGAACGKIARNESDGAENGGYGSVGDRVGRLDTKQEALKQPCQRESSGDTDGHPDGRQ